MPVGSSAALTCFFANWKLCSRFVITVTPAALTNSFISGLSLTIFICWLAFRYNWLGQDWRGWGSPAWAGRCLPVGAVGFATARTAPAAIAQLPVRPGRLWRFRQGGTFVYLGDGLKVPDRQRLRPGPDRN